MALADFFNLLIGLLRLFWSLEAEDSCLFLLLLFLLDFLLVLLSWSLAGEECENTSWPCTDGNKGDDLLIVDLLLLLLLNCELGASTGLLWFWLEQNSWIAGALMIWMFEQIPIPCSPKLKTLSNFSWISDLACCNLDRCDKTFISTLVMAVDKAWQSVQHCSLMCCILLHACYKTNTHV